MTLRQHFEPGTACIPYNMLYRMGMTRNPLPRYIADVRLAIEISGLDEADAEARLEEIRDFIADRLSRSTFRRLSGMPEVMVADIISEVTPA